jgi:hypothetical protein
MSDSELKEEFARYCKGLVQTDYGWDYYHDRSKNDAISEFLLEKMWKFIGMLNEDDSKFMEMDIQNEIYDLL